MAHYGRKRLAQYSPKGDMRGPDGEVLGAVDLAEMHDDGT